MESKMIDDFPGVDQVPVAQFERVTPRLGPFAVRTLTILGVMLLAVGLLQSCDFWRHSSNNYAYKEITPSAKVRSTNPTILDIWDGFGNRHFYSDDQFANPINWADYISVPHHTILSAYMGEGSGMVSLTLDSSLNSANDTTVTVDTSKYFYGTDISGVDTTGNPTKYRFAVPSVNIIY